MPGFRPSQQFSLAQSGHNTQRTPRKTVDIVNINLALGGVFIGDITFVYPPILSCRLITCKKVYTCKLSIMLVLSLMSFLSPQFKKMDCVTFLTDKSAEIKQF